MGLTTLPAVACGLAPSALPGKVGMQNLKEKFETRKKKKDSTGRAKKLWINNLFLLAGDCPPEKKYVDLEFNAKIFNMFLHLYETSLSHVAINKVLSYAWTRRSHTRTMENGLRLMGVTPFGFIMFCFYRLHHPKQKFFFSLNYVFKHALYELNTALDEFDFRWSKILSYAQSTPNGQLLIDKIKMDSCVMDKAVDKNTNSNKFQSLTEL